MGLAYHATALFVAGDLHLRSTFAFINSDSTPIPTTLTVQPACYNNWVGASADASSQFHTRLTLDRGHHDPLTTIFYQWSMGLVIMQESPAFPAAILARTAEARAKTTAFETPSLPFPGKTRRQLVQAGGTSRRTSVNTTRPLPKASPPLGWRAPRKVK